VVLILFIAAFLGSAVSFALWLAIAPAWSFLAGMVGGAIGVTLAAISLAYVHRKHARALPSVTSPSTKADPVSPR
jgi:uncharacterized membrane protein YdcZ (DUF606 family)